MQSVWFDEAYSIFLAKQTIGELLRLTSLDTHPPLYYLLLHVWGNVFGWSEIALRSLSVLAMGGATFVAGLFVKRWFGARTAIIAVLFVATAPFLLRYGFEIRMYSIASLIGIAATYVLTIALTSTGKKQRWLFAVYAVLVALSMYTLYYMAFLWIAHVVWLFLYGKTKTSKTSLYRQQWILALTFSVVLFLPWLPTFISQLTNGALAPISQAMTLENMVGIISFNFAYQPVWQLGPWISLLIAAVLVILPLIIKRAYAGLNKQQRPYYTLLLLYFSVPILLVIVISLLRPLYVERYLSQITIGGMLLVGVSVAITTLRKDKAWQLTGLFLLAVQLYGVAHLGEVGNYNFQRLEKPSVAKIVEKAGPCDDRSVILANDPYVAIELSYYFTNCQVKFYSQTDELRGGYAPLSNSQNRFENPEQQLKGVQTINYIHYGQPELRMPSNFTQVGQDTIGALTVARFSAE